MKWKISPWHLLPIICVSLLVGVAFDRAALCVHWDLTHIGRDMNKLESALKLGMSKDDVIKKLGTPATTTNSLEDLIPYNVSAPKGEKVMLYAEYPWGVLVYVNKQQRVSRLVLVRHP